MASATKISLVLLLSSLFLHATLAEIICEELPNEICAFSIASSGKRCLLETFSSRGGGVEHQCRSSEVVVERISGYIETDRCVNACGVDRNAVGISSDSLLEPQFTTKLCSPDCYLKCPNIIDLYFNLAAGEGVYLPDLCVVQSSNPHRSMLVSSSGAAPGPVAVGPEEIAASPAPSPSSL